MQTSVPKQFLLLNGKPMFLYAMEAFISAIPDISIILVVAETDKGKLQNFQQEHQFPENIKIVYGGDSRFVSVKNSLDTIEGEEALVAIHDAARPLVSIELISTAFKDAGNFGCAVPGIPVPDSMFFSDKEQTKSLKRENYFLAQTPQCFYLPLIRKAYEAGFQSWFTDDASVWEAAGNKIHPISGDPRNFKITTEADFKLAEMML